MEKKYIVYIHINKVNKKTYIGITSMNPEKRWGKNGNCYRNQLFGRAINKYGWDNFEHIILFENRSKEDAEKLERLFIKVLMSNANLLGYNVDNGGNGKGRMSNRTKQIISGRRRQIRGSLHSGSKKVYCDGKIFDTIKECADYYNIEYSRLSEWLRGFRGAPQNFIDLGLRYLDEVNKIMPFVPNTGSKNNMSKEIICNNIIFESISECANFYDVKSSNMSRWLRGERIMPKKFIELGLSYHNQETKIKTKNDTKIQVVCNDVVFNSIVDCAKHLNENPNNVYSWLLGNTPMPEKYINLGLMYYDKGMEIKEASRKKVECESVVYDTIKSCAEHYNVKLSVMSAWLLQTRNTPQKFIDMGLRYLNSNIDYKPQKYPRKVICGNDVFNSIKDCSKFYNINESTLRSWLSGQNKTPQEYIDLGLRYLDELIENAEIQE